VKLFADHSNGSVADLQLGYKRLILSVGQVPVSREVPRSEQVAPFFAEDLTVGWILNGVASGRVPDPGPIDPVHAATTSLTLALRQSRFGRAKEPCQTLGSPVTRRLEKGESMGIDGGTLAVVYLPAAGDASNPLRFSGANRPRLLAATGPLTLRLSPVAGTKPVRVCA